MGTCSHHQGSGDSCFPQQLLKPSVSLFGIRGLLQTQALSFEADLFQTYSACFSVVSAMASVHLTSITMSCCPSICCPIMLVAGRLFVDADAKQWGVSRSALPL